MTTYYVATTGSDSGAGSAVSPFKSISQALRKVKAGDEVVVKAGTYAEKVVINKSGSADGGYITVRAEVPGSAKIAPPPGKDAAVIVLGDFVKVDGFELTGAKAGITTMGVHHIEITRNHVHDNTGNGISVNRSEFVLVEGNEVHDNAKQGARQGFRSSTRRTCPATPRRRVRGSSSATMSPTTTRPRTAPRPTATASWSTATTGRTTAMTTIRSRR